MCSLVPDEGNALTFRHLTQRGSDGDVDTAS